LFGLDRIYRFHKAMAVAAGVLILLHPLLLALDMGDFSLLSSFQWPWPVLLGKFGALALIVIVLSSLLYRAIHLSYERWRGLHNLAAIVLLAAGFVHAWLSGRDLLLLVPLQVIFAFLLAVGVASYAAAKVIGPARRRLFTVDGLRQETSNAWTLTLTPGPGSAPLRSLPGQFQFITMERMRRGNCRPEEHPFTIASCGCGAQTHESTIKESGDFTRTIKEVQSGDRVRVQGPFGRFSYLLHPGEKDFVFIAGGIGITPFMSMLRHMRSTGSEDRVFLLYANRSREDIAFREELEAIAREAHPRLEVVHVLERPPADWGGEVGRVGPELIERRLGGSIADRAFYVCGPPRMMESVLGSLRRLGVPRRRLHSERFAL
jgi:predicted ferric reductase